MITKTKEKYSSKQNWSIGQTVKVGFMSLEVVGVKDNVYLLKSGKGVNYSFDAYTGLVRLDD